MRKPFFHLRPLSSPLFSEQIHLVQTELLDTTDAAEKQRLLQRLEYYLHSALNGQKAVIQVHRVHSSKSSVKTT